jgi:putative PIG3 family NAD(P)H quinone oxidoreductase
MAAQMMRAVVMKGAGAPDVLEIGQVPVPEPGPEQLLVRVRATALNRADTLQRRGLYPVPPGESEILGLELAGEVVRWGKSAAGFKAGDRVFGLVGGGGYAEFALLDHRMAIPIPPGWSDAQGAAVAEVFYTANETIFVLGGLSEGQTVLIHAGGSGVGTAGIQMASAIGARVLFTAGTTEKIQRAEALSRGAQVTGINYKTQDFQQEVMRLTADQGVDVVLDFLGGSYLARNMAVLKTTGRLVIAALMGGAKAEIDLGLLQRRRLSVMGSALRSRGLAEKREVTQRFRERWWPMLLDGRIQPVIDSTFPLEQARQAHEHMEANRNFGKIILTV